jgi:hypothetical protein
MTASYARIPVPRGANWSDIDPGWTLPEPVTAALDRARGALVRSVHRVERDGSQLVALGYHRPGTAQEKLTAVAGSPQLLRELADRAADSLAASGGISLKLEVPAGADALATAAQDAGFRALARPRSAAPLPHDPDQLPLGFVRRIGGWAASELPYFRQTTEFTCGPVAALTAANALGLAPALDRTAEVQFWREATSAPGCDGYGLASALADRGVRADLVVNTTRALQIETEPAPWQRELREFVQAEFRTRAERAGVPIRLADPPVPALLDIAATAAMVVLLIDEKVMHAEPCPHWVVLHGVHQGIGLIEDPWTDDDLGETWVDAHELPVTADALSAMAGWNGYRSALVLVPRS